MCAGKHKLANLTAIVDYNKMQSTVRPVRCRPWSRSPTSGGLSASTRSKSTVTTSTHCAGADLTPVQPDRPVAVICHTVKGKGMPFAENEPNWHHKNKVPAEPIAAHVRRTGVSSDAANLDQHGHKLAKRDPRVVFIGSDLGAGTLKAMQEGDAGPLSSWREFPSRNRRHVGGHGDGGLHPLRQHHRDLPDPALLRAGRGRPLPA